jgi:hypothetical protein
VALGVPGRLRPRIFSTFGTTRVVGRHTNAPVAFTPGEIPGTHFQRLSRPQGTWLFFRKEPLKKSQVTPPKIDTGTVRLVAQRPTYSAEIKNEGRMSPLHQNAIMVCRGTYLPLTCQGFSTTLSSAYNKRVQRQLNIEFRPNFCWKY